MATPKRKTSHSRTAKRNAQWLGALNAPATQVCPHCGEPVQTYRACPSCGYYRGRQVVKSSDEAAD